MRVRSPKNPIATSIVAIVAAVGAASASAHGSDPNYESVVNRVAPAVSGVVASVPGGGSHLELTNRSGRQLVVEGYDGEPFARILPDGTVQLNLNSPAYWLNRDSMGNVAVPAHASVRAVPDWQTQDRTGTLDWHDHRIHWMGMSVPKQVANRDARTKVFAWRVPIVVGGEDASIDGTLWWRGAQSGFPAEAVLAFGVLTAVASLLAVVLWVRNRRGAGDRPKDEVA